MTLQGNGHDIKSQSRYKGFFQSNTNGIDFADGFLRAIKKHKKTIDEATCMGDTFNFELVGANHPHLIADLLVI